MLNKDHSRFDRDIDIIQQITDTVGEIAQKISAGSYREALKKIKKLKDGGDSDSYKQLVKNALNTFVVDKHNELYSDGLTISEMCFMKDWRRKKERKKWNHRLPARTRH